MIMCAKISRKLPGSSIRILKHNLLFMLQDYVQWCSPMPRHPWQQDIRGIANVTQNGWDNAAAVVSAATAVGNPINGGDWSA